MVHEGEMRRSEDEFSDTMSRGMSCAVAIFDGVLASPLETRDAKAVGDCAAR